MRLPIPPPFRQRLFLSISLGSGRSQLIFSYPSSSGRYPASWHPLHNQDGLKARCLVFCREVSVLNAILYNRLYRFPVLFSCYQSPAFNPDKPFKVLLLLSCAEVLFFIQLNNLLILVRARDSNPP